MTDEIAELGTRPNIPMLDGHLLNPTAERAGVSGIGGIVSADYVPEVVDGGIRVEMVITGEFVSESAHIIYFAPPGSQRQTKARHSRTNR